ncbi:MAG: DNA-3-methyladenine glycosylase family protein, partial [Micromonosporaceae bacterium]
PGTPLGAGEPLGATGPFTAGEPLGAGPAAEATVTTVFPDPAAVAEAPDTALRMPKARRRTVRAVAAAVASGELDLSPSADREATRAGLLAIPGIGPWTTEYVAMRALGDPGAFLPTDLVVRRSAAWLGLPDSPAALDERSHRWRPWRAYAVIRLWRQTPDTDPIRGG